MSKHLAKNIPEGFHSITPYLVNDDVRGVIAFLEKVFYAEVRSLTPHPQHADKVMNAEVRIGNSMIMLGDARDGVPAFPATLYVYVDDVDGAYGRALREGAERLMEPTDMFYGDRNAGVLDAAGNQWWIATHLEDLSEEEMARRMRDQMGLKDDS